VLLKDASMFTFMSSKWTWTCLLGCAGMVGLATALAAADQDPVDANPYSVISDRNIFHLNPPPPAPPSEETPVVEARKLMLTGIVKKGDSLKVWLAIPAKDNKETTIYLTLAPGEKEHDVELVKIRSDKEEVDVINAGIPQTLTVKSNTFAQTGAPAAHFERGGAPAMPSGIPGLGHRSGFPSRNGMPMQSAPGAALTPRGGSAIIAGGGGGGTAFVSGGGGIGNAGSSLGSGYGTSGNGTIVSGGTPYAATGMAPANTAGGQIATSLFNQQSGKYQPTTPTAPPAPPMVQAAGMLAQKATMGSAGPPLPPSLQSMLDGGPEEPPGGPPGGP
jgi:hypothetical protein